MANRYLTAGRLACWKRDTCVGCGSRYCYRVRRKGVNTPKLRSDASGVDLQPCPHCGLYQPDMVGARRGYYHLWITLGTSIFLGTALVFLGGLPSVQSDLSMWIAIVLGVMILPAQFVACLWNPNRNLKANRKKALEAVRNGDLDLLRTRDEDNTPPRFGLRIGHLVALALMGLSLPFVTAGELLRSVQDWPYNRDCFPNVVGPGDEITVDFPEKIESVKGLWAGQATGEILNIGELNAGNLHMHTSSKLDTWGDKISVEHTNSTETSRLWMRIALPDNEGLAGKEMKLRLQLTAVHPVAQGNGFVNQSDSFSHTVTIRLAKTQHAGRIYDWVRHGGSAVALIGITGAGLILYIMARRLRSQANPSKIFDRRPEPEETE
jgi:hypothetical protein